MHTNLTKSPADRERPYRFGVVTYRDVVKMWELACVRNLIGSGTAQLVFLMLTDADEPTRGQAGPESPARRWLARLCRRLFFDVDALKSVTGQDVRASLVGKESAAQGLPCSCSFFHERDSGRIRDLDLDFILCLGDGSVVPDLAEACRYGAWRFSTGDGSMLSAGLPFFREIVHGERFVEVVLRGDMGRVGNATILRHGFYPLARTSLARDLNAIVEDIAKWPMWVCLNIRSGTFRPSVVSSPTPQRKISTGFPDYGAMLTWGTGVVWSRIKRKLSNLFLFVDWNIAIVRRPIHTFLEKHVADDAEFVDCSLHAESFWADPFGVMRDGALTILFEDFHYEGSKGSIGYMSESDRKSASRTGTVFDMPYHMSYPYVFEDEGTVYCVPESGAAGKIELFRAVTFPHTWERVAVIADDISGVDATIFRHQGRWWLACTQLEHGSNTNLFLYFADTLFGPWEPHAHNPVKTDVRSSRPAGTPFVYEERLYRPSQDCSESYGKRVCINRVLRLGPGEFEEEPACLIEPDPDGDFPDGLHTLSSAGEFTLIDGLRYRFMWPGFRRTLRKRWIKATGFVQKIRTED